MKMSSLFKIIIILAALIITSCKSIPLTSLLECNTDKYPDEADVIFFNAAKYGNFEEAKIQLKKKANINASDRLDQSALMWACWNGHEKIIREMSEFDSKQIEKKRKNYKPLQYATKSTEEYNSLFCLIMSSALPTKKSLELQKLLIKKSPELMDMRDSFKETVLHKAVRSENTEFLNFYLSKLVPKNLPIGKTSEILESQNIYGETPFLVAVKKQNIEMTRELIKRGSDVLAKDSDGKNAAIIALNGGLGDIEIFMEIMKAYLDKKILHDDSLETEFSAISKEYEHDPILEYRTLYQDIREGEIKEPTSLKNRKNMETELLEITSKNSISTSDIEKVKSLLNAAPGIIRARKKIDFEGVQKSAMQLCIENSGNAEFFSILLRSLPSNIAVQISGGLGDYLICAIRYNRPEIINVLLSIAKRGHTPEWLMADWHQICDELSTDKQTCNPVAQFVKIPELWQGDELSLFRKLLSYYAAQFKNSQYVIQVLEAATGLKSQNINSESLILALYEYEGFKKIRPIQFVLLEQNYLDILYREIEKENGLFDGENGKKQYERTDTNHDKFQILLDRRSDEKKIQAIIELLKKKNLYKDSSIFDSECK